MKFNKQAGYMDMQMTPALIGVILMLMFVGSITDPDFNLDQDLLAYSIYLFLATAALLYGFVMHIDSLRYPESPFNKHTSPLFMTLLCAGPLAYAAYRFYRAAMLAGVIVYAVLALLLVATAIGVAVYRSDDEQPPAES